VLLSCWLLIHCNARPHHRLSLPLFVTHSSPSSSSSRYNITNLTELVSDHLPVQLSDNLYNTAWICVGLTLARTAWMFVHFVKMTVQYRESDAGVSTQDHDLCELTYNTFLTPLAVIFFGTGMYHEHAGKVSGDNARALRITGMPSLFVLVNKVSASAAQAKRHARFISNARH
jgi:hypothetical protein